MPDPQRPPVTSTVTRLLHLARPEAGRIALGTLFLLVGSGLTLVYPQGMRQVIDGALARAGVAGSGPLPLSIRTIALLLVAVALIQGLAIGTRFVLFSIAGERVVARLRDQLYRHILDQEIGFFDRERTGELTSRLGTDTAMLQSAVSSNVSMGLRFLAQGAGGLALLFFTSPRLAALMIAVVPAVAVSAVIYGRRVRRLAKQVQDAVADSTAVAEESLAGLRTVRAFAAEEREAGRYGAAIERSFQLARTRSFASATFLATVTFAGYSAAALVLWYGGRLVAQGELTVGGLTSFLIYTLIVGFALGGLADLWAELMKAVGAAARVFALLDRRPAMLPRGGRTLDRPRGELTLQGVRFAYPSRPELPVLADVDLGVAPGEVIALVGPSGSGKSTIAALLQRFYDPLAGVVRLDGQDLRELDPQWLRLQIGTVAQEPTLFSTTIEENIRYGRQGATREQVEAAARAANAHEFIARFPDGYATEVGERGVQLSGGQKQRVAIARAVLKDPRVLILDEATSALDAESEHLVQQALERLMEGRTTLIIAHRLSTVRAADRVLVVDGGRIVQSGRHEALMQADGLYRRLVERQFVAA